MTYRSNIESLLRSLDDVRRMLAHLVMSRDGSLVAKYGEEPDHVEWGYVARNLETNLDNIAWGEPEIFNHLYGNAIQDIKSQLSNQPTPTDLPAIRPGLKEKEQLALDFIKEHGPVKGIVVCRRINVKETSFRKHYVPILKQWGVRNDKSGDGYYWKAD